MISTTLLDRYRLEAELGRGGMGVVYRAHDALLDRPVAVKLLSAAALGTEGRARLLREARAAAQLNHPNIASVYDAGESDGVPFIVMELVEGHSLNEDRPSTLEDIVTISRQVCEALEHAHTHGIVHRDLKPENVLLTPLSRDGGTVEPPPLRSGGASHPDKVGAGAPGVRAKLMDFGLARSVASRLTMEGGLVGTVFYLAPEQALGREVDGRADLYALGVMLYELVTGRLPFASDDPLGVISQHLHVAPTPPRMLRPDVPPRLETLILKLMAKDPAARYPSARDVALALGEVLAAESPGEKGVPRHNLPLLLSSFVGRAQEMDQVKQLVLESRLVTLTGAGGSGKTRLALQVAVDLLRAFPDGAWLVGLASLTHPAHVPAAAAAVLGVREQSEHPLADTLSDYLRSRELLLVLDNCEHLIGACAELAETLLRTCPDLRILATSREPMGISGETAWLIPSLSTPEAVPSDSFSAGDLTEMARYEAVRLFLDRAQTVQPGFALTARNAEAVAEICRRLDGIPLAIELAAARLRALSAEQIAARLDDRFNLLTLGSRTALPRQQTLLATMEWSHDLLSETERILFRRLSVFAGSWTLEAAEEVTSDTPAQSADGGPGGLATGHELAPTSLDARHVSPPEVLDLLTQLVNKSLVVAEERGAETRYRMLETIRQHAQGKLAQSGEQESIQGRHLALYLRLAEEVEPQLRALSQVSWLERLEDEHYNLRAALEFSLSGPVGTAVELPSHQGSQWKAEAGLRMAGALYRFWYLHGYWSEGQDWSRRLLSLEDRASGPPKDPALARARAKVLQGLGWLAGESGEENVPYGESLALCRELGDQWGAAFCLRGLGEWALNQEDYVLAEDQLGESLAIFRELKDPWGIGLALFNSGWLSFNQDDQSGAEARWQESLAEFRRSGDRWGAAVSLGALAYIARLRYDLHRSVEYSDEALRLFREIGDKAGIADSLSRLGNVAFRRDDFRQAAALFEDSLALERELGYRGSAAFSTSMLAVIASYQGQYERAAGLGEESLALWRERENEWGIAWGQYVLGLTEYFQGALARAAALLEGSVALFRAQNDTNGMAQTLDALGLTALQLGELPRAAKLLEEGLEASRKSGDKRSLALSLNHLGRLAQARGDFAEAASYYQKGLSARRDLGARRGTTEALHGLAAIAVAKGQAERGARLFGAAEVLRESLSTPMPSVEREDYEGDLEAAREALGEERFATAWAKGRAMTPEQAVSLALEGVE